jgi:Spy/CpxP family protein refolding chaperone
MISESKYKVLKWVVIILFAINISTVLSFYIHARQSERPQETATSERIDEQVDKGARQFREKLGLDENQVVKFREINREYNRAANRITRDLEILRIQMVDELGLPVTDSVKIRDVNRKFGLLHENLKNLTADYYLAMKDICNEEQKQQLHLMFRSMLQQDPAVAPGQGRRRGRGPGTDN